MSTLFQLKEKEDQLNKLIEDWADANEGDLSGIADVIDKTLADNSEALKDKVSAYVGLIKSKERDASIRRDEAKRISSLAKFDENASKLLKDRLRWYMDSTGKTKIDIVTNIVSTQANGGKAPLLIDSDAPIPDDVPDEFRVVSYSYNNDAIRAAVDQDDETLKVVNAWLEDQHDDPEKPFEPVTKKDLGGYLKAPWASIGERGRSLRIR